MGPITRAKFRLDEITIGAAGKPTKFVFTAVYPQPELDGYKHDEDHAFWNATPYGRLEISIQNAHAAELFTAGESYYLDFTPANKPEPVQA